MATLRGGVDDTHDRLRDLFAAGDIAGARRALLELSPQAREAVAARVGPEAFERMLRTARGVRAAPLGRVVVIHGIMGGKLATVAANDPTDVDLIWVSYWRLIEGRLARFTLDANAQQADPRWSVQVQGLLDEYMPLVMDLSKQWDVLPVAFDWRLDIDISAQRLDEQIRNWAKGEPVHIVAHSMGGLVSRRFMRNFASTWAGMKGRLIMLGTPNRGSFAIPFVLTGEESIVKWLAFADINHNTRELLDIINTFPGSYQMLPSPLVQAGDDRQRLYDAATWGSFPVPQKYLDLGRRFHQEMQAVQDPDRLVYIAGYDQKTPWTVHVEAPGQFTYTSTLDGDGRVPHQLGLLPGVPTYYVAEKHGDLPANTSVMAALHDLLATGTTTQLPNTRPASRGVRVDDRRQTADEFTIGSPVPSRKATLRAARAVDAQDAARIESQIVSVFAGGGDRSPVAPTTASAQKAPATPRRRGPPVVLEVMWANITQVDGEVLACGHYEGVEPQAAELALDRAISGGGELIITSQTRRGILRGAVGDINFYPWWDRKKTVAIAGMGRPGSFGTQSLRRTTRSLAEAVAPLRSVKTVSTLLIGSGVGNLELATAVDAMLEGLGDALKESLPRSSVRRIRIVEWELGRAQRIFDAVARSKCLPQGVELVKQLVTGPGGEVGQVAAMSAMMLASAWRAIPLRSVDFKDEAKFKRAVLAAAKKAAPQILKGTKQSAALIAGCEKALAALPLRERGDLLSAAARLQLARASSSGGDAGMQPTRVSFVRVEGGICAAAISDTAVVPERLMPVDWTTVQEIVRRMTDPQDGAMASDLSRLMRSLFVPRDFQDRLNMGDRVIVEVDRDTASIQWEMMQSFDGDAQAVPLALDRPIARQLRTLYSPAPPEPFVVSPQMRALVIGDPGDPDKQLSLEGARVEALEVAKILRARGVAVDLLVGAQNTPRMGDLQGVAPATIVDVLRLLENNTYDILHYAGHGNFDPQDPAKRAGWIFGDRYFTSRDLAGVSHIPAVVVANACLSGLTSNSDLLPGLADEFFHRGVRNYIGTAWPISDSGAIRFSRTLYETLLPLEEGAPVALGDALLKARAALQAEEAVYGALWAAYQHYGDPAFTLRSPAGVGDDEPDAAKPRNRKRRKPR